MKTSTTVSWTCIHGTGSESTNASMGEAFSLRMARAPSEALRRDPVVLQGRYIVSPSGNAQVMVSVDQKAFKRTMAVREMNSLVDSRSSVEIDECAGTATSR